tara:strand:- start:6805 stop:7278 length:474 start_codon:yes stop_codon:yes gene_type:complete
VHFALGEKKDRSTNMIKIDSKMAHKVSPDNVMISKPTIKNGVHSFQCTHETTEFVLDHESKHVNGILLLEACRQAAIATCHLNGVRKGSKSIALLGINASYKEKVNKTDNIHIESSCYLSNMRGAFDSATVECKVMQNDECKAKIVFTGNVFIEEIK